MKPFVITIEDLKESVESAERCIKSGKKYGIKVNKFSAFTPKDDPLKFFKEEGLSPMGFDEDRKYSRNLNCLSAFRSHYSLWKQCVKENVNYLILEHDAVFKDKLPIIGFGDICNFGAPSYGSFNTPHKLGLNGLTSKLYLPGAHAYAITPLGARLLINQAKVYARPTDVFINLHAFPDIKEYYPWPVEAVDDFTTIQHEGGCGAKHRYSEEYKII